MSRIDRYKVYADKECYGHRLRWTVYDELRNKVIRSYRHKEEAQSYAYYRNAWWDITPLSKTIMMIHNRHENKRKAKEKKCRA